MSMMKSIARSGADGNTRLLKEYGGSSSKKCYASGGSVHEDAHETSRTKVMKKADGGSIDGAPSKGRLDRPGRKMKGKDKNKGGTNVNVVIMPKADGAPAALPMGAGPSPMPMPPKPPVMAGPPMPPPSAGGPPMPPMHKNGGKVKGAFKHGGHVKKANGGHIKADGQTTKSEAEAEGAVERKHGGKVKKADGGGVSDYLRGRARDKAIGAVVQAVPTALMGAGTVIDPEPVGKAILGTGTVAGAAATKKLYDDYKNFKGAADKFGKTGLPEGPSDDDGKKKGGRVHRRAGGKVDLHMKAGAGSGEGRLEKIKAYGK